MTDSKQLDLFPEKKKKSVTPEREVYDILADLFDVDGAANMMEDEFGIPRNEWSDLEGWK